MPRIHLSLVTALASLALATAAPAAEIVLERSAVDKLVKQALFNQGGRYVIQDGACHAFMETPSVELKDGRIRIRSRLNSRVGMDLGNSCVGVDLVSWTVVSGRPVAAGGKVRLDDLRVDSVDDPNLRLVLESGLVPALPRAVELDVLGSVSSMLGDGAAGLEATVDAFQIDAVQVSPTRLTVRFDFRLVAK